MGKHLAEFKIIKKFEDGRLMIWIPTPEDLREQTQGFVRDIFMNQEVTVIHEDLEEDTFKVVGFEMQGYENRIVGDNLGLLLKYAKKKPEPT